MDIVSRAIRPEFMAMMASYPIVTVLGPRQSGKTTFVKHMLANKPYVSLENPDEQTFASIDPRGFLARFPDGAILDEIQRQPQLLSYLQGIVDETDQKGLFVLTGSHQLSLHESITQSLAGRTAILKLLPFSQSELQDVHLTLPLNDMLYHGMYPRIFKNKIEPTKFYRDYLQTYIERDVRKMINVKNLMLFQQFIKLCASRIGQLLNTQNMSNDLGVSHHTVNNWLSILEASFIIFRLPPYFENFGKRLIKSSKLYFTDVGLAAYLLDIHNGDQIARDPLRGNLFENFVILECWKHQLNEGIEPSFYFYRDHNGHEVDLIYKVGKNLIPIEIKASQTFNRIFLKGMKYFSELVPDRVPSGAVVYSGEQQQTIQQFHVFNYEHINDMFEFFKKIC